MAPDDYVQTPASQPARKQNVFSIDYTVCYLCTIAYVRACVGYKKLTLPLLLLLPVVQNCYSDELMQPTKATAARCRRHNCA